MPTWDLNAGGIQMVDAALLNENNTAKQRNDRKAYYLDVLVERGGPALDKIRRESPG